MATQNSNPRSERGVEDPIIEMRGASVTYDEGESYVLDDVSLDIGRGEIVGIIGESGLGQVDARLVDARRHPRPWSPHWRDSV